MNPIAVALFYSTLSSSTTSQNNWICLHIFKSKYGDLSVSIIGLILYSFQHVSFYKSEYYDHTHLPNPFRYYTLTQYHYYIKIHCLDHIHSNYT
jgi:hypothetical protein